MDREGILAEVEARGVAVPDGTGRRSNEEIGQKTKPGMLNTGEF